jgi:hypothetical protein
VEKDRIRKVKLLRKDDNGRHLLWLVWCLISPDKSPQWRNFLIRLRLINTSHSESNLMAWKYIVPT